MQTITIAGRIGANAEVKEFDDNAAISFSVAVREKTTKGEAVTTWYSATIWRKKDAAQAAKYLTKGTAVTLSGKPKVQAWLHEGKPQGRIHINVDSFTLQGSPMSAPAAGGETPESDEQNF